MTATRTGLASLVGGPLGLHANEPNDRTFTERGHTERGQAVNSNNRLRLVGVSGGQREGGSVSGQFVHMGRMSL